MDDFEGKTAVVTGAASGIGRGLAERFAHARMNVVLGDIEEEALERVVEELEARQVPVLGVPTNTMVEDSVRALADQAIERFGRVHVLCNNAGVAASSSAGRAVWELPDADWNWVMGVNFYGVLYGLRAFVPHMLEHGEPAHVVNTASLAALMPGGGPYGVSKHAVLALTEGLQNDLVSRGANVNASVLCPGFVDTRIHDAERNRPADLAAAAGGAEEAAAAAELMKDLLGRGMQPSEIADIVFDAIAENRFYVLPHPAWDGFLRERVEQILARGPVATVDQAAMQARRDAGEQL